MTEHKEKDFDCLKLKDRIQLEIYNEIKDLSPEEEIEFFKKKVESGIFSQMWKDIIAQ